MSSKELFSYSYENMLKDVISVAIGYELDRNKAALVKRCFMMGYNNMILKIKSCKDKSALNSILPICTKMHELEKIFANLYPDKDSEYKIRSIFRLIHINIIGYGPLQVMGEFFTEISKSKSYTNLIDEAQQLKEKTK